jgi:hypothetical protein
MNDVRAQRSTRQRWLDLALAVGVLTAFVLALYSRLIFTNRVLATGDILLYFYPYRDFAAHALAAGQIPFWNPYLFSGAPFLANPQAAVLYPLHWPLIWLDVTSQIYWSAALHTFLLGLGGYVLLRRWGYGLWAGLAAGLTLAGSGFYGGLIGHINQMNAAAWLPWAMAVIPIRRPDRKQPNAKAQRRKGAKGSSLSPAQQGCHALDSQEAATAAEDARRGIGDWLLAVGLLGLLVALMLLAGHTQSAYINLFAVGIWALWRSIELRTEPADSAPGRRWTAWLRRLSVWPIPLLIYFGGVLLGGLLSAAQLLPSLELSSLGLRGGGLSYQEASSFSLKPFKLLWTLLPSYGLARLGAVFDTPAFSEFVAYVGLIGLLLATLGAWKGRGVARGFGILFALLGLFLALGRWNPFYYLFYEFVPGFDLFRTPARWMMLYTLGVAVLVGAGMERLASWTVQVRNRPAPRHVILPLLLIALAGELLLASLALLHTQPTAPQAVEDVRTAPAHLLSDPKRTQVHPAAAGRFLGMSTITYDPGDLPDFRRIMLESDPPQLSPEAFDDLIIALKVQELLVPNLPLLWRIPAVDGYDGGVLPLARYNQLLSIFVPKDQLVPDGRLREQITDVPPAEQLGLLNVQYVVTDKVRDLWFDDVYYDRQIGARLSAAEPQVSVDAPVPFEATHVDLIGMIDGDADLIAALKDQTQPALILRTLNADGVEETLLNAGGQPGAHLADGALDSSMAATSGAQIAFRDVEGGRQEYRVRVPLAHPQTPQRIELVHQGQPFDVVVQALTLYDERSGMFSALLPSDRGRFRLVHSGDVKIYENLDVRPRASLVAHTLRADSPDEALELLRSLPELTNSAVVEGMDALDSVAAPSDSAEVVAYAPERVEVQTRSTDEALLVLSDSYYPGWTATVDGEPAPVRPTNVLMRGVRVPAGEHTVVFQFAPSHWRSGLAISAAGIVLGLLLLLSGLVGKLRRTARSGV